MKRKSFKLIVLFILMTVVSCEEPKTVVTNIVHPDGSVTRQIEMRNTKNKFDISSLQVPFDNSWAIKDTLEIGEKGDTTWIKRAEKQFKSVDEINLVYAQDSGANKDISRHAGFKNTFKWFNTEFRFSEKIDKKLSFGYPVKDFLNSEELAYFYSPENMKQEKVNSPDSLKYKALSDSVSKKTEMWGAKNLISEWIGEFSKLTEKNAGNEMTMKALKSRENEIVTILKANESKFDSLWSAGILLKEFIGEANALKYKTEADTAIAIVTRNFFVNFKEYSVRIVMPGKLIGTNGFIDSSHILLWPVKSDYFMTEPYEMWAESKVPNRWAWIVSGLFLVFVFTGVILRVIKKG
ncbi:MAG: hypothetical protein EPN88_00360 [Bacteroidetes bacterium]|nr:MAG: hypothetical protein EPN88_00360 [Bacteroidota bacterium]